MFEICLLDLLAPEDKVKKTDLKLKKLRLDQCKLSYGKNVKFMWIRVALVEKLLAKILASLAEHAEYVNIITAAMNIPLLCHENRTFVFNLICFSANFTNQLQSWLILSMDLLWPTYLVQYIYTMFYL
jgi:hypothetical protein